jgi:hypothetical protein
MEPDTNARPPADSSPTEPAPSPTSVDEPVEAAAASAEPAAADVPWQPANPPDDPLLAAIGTDDRPGLTAAGAPWRAPGGHPPVPAVYRLAFDVYARRPVSLLALGALMGVLAASGLATQLDPGTAGFALLLFLIPVGFVATSLMIAVAGGSLRRPELAASRAFVLGFRRSLHYVASAILVSLAMLGVAAAALFGPLVVLVLVAAADDTLAKAAIVLVIPATVIGMLVMAVVGARLVLAWPGLILGHEPVVAGLTAAWARTSGRKTFAVLSVGIPYVLYGLGSSAAGMLSVVSPAAASTVALVAASVLLPYGIAAIVAADHLLRAFDLEPSLPPGPAIDPAGLGPLAAEGVAGTRGARRAVGTLMVGAVVLAAAGWVAGIGATIQAVGVPGTVSLGRAPGASPCGVSEPSAVFAPGETVYFGVSLSREVRPGETLHAAIEQEGTIVGEVDIEVTSAGRCYSEEGGIEDLPVGAYRLAFTVQDELLAEGSFEVR